MEVLELLVKELINDLKEFNPNAEITLVDSESIELSYVCRDKMENKLDKLSTNIVFIEGRDLCPTCVHEYIEASERMCSYYGKPCRMVTNCEEYEEFYEP